MNKLLKILLVILRAKPEESPCTNTGVSTRGFLAVLGMTIIIYLLSASCSFAQCAMCKAVVESNMKNDANTVGAGLNSGILYLIAFPYILLLVGGLIWYRSQKSPDTG